jgi:hypothetical protein
MNCDALTRTVSAYELAQRNRIATAAHLRASMSESESASETMVELNRIELQTEKALAKEMARRVVEHPAWPWLERVRGVGPTLSARLLARLRIERAPTPSSFWKFCGLSTVEGSRYTCARCGATVMRVRGTAAPRRHLSPTGGSCDQRLDETPPEGIVRVAARLPSRGQARAFDVGARTLCHIIGVSFLRRGGKYREVYYARRAKFLEQHPDWTPLHSHLAGMRVMEKLFLAHLWSVWAERLGMPERTPYPVRMRGRAGVSISPWEMVDS